MKKILPFLILLLYSVVALAQNFYVESLTLDEKNLRAQIYPKLDLNDKKCCVIMVSTPNMDDAQRRKLEFSCDMGAEVVSKDFPTGVIELYVSPHAGTLIIAHPDLGRLNYDVPIDLKEMKTYNMVLMSAKATTIVEESLTANYLVINFEPKDARVFIDDEFVESRYGAVSKLLSIGVEHNVRIEKNLYYSIDTMVVTKASGTVTINKRLRPAFGFIEVSSLPESGAKVIINDKEVGVTPYKSDPLASGEYSVQVVKAMYKQSSKTVRVIDGNTTEAELTMQPNFAEITLTTDSESTIYLDDKEIGRGSWTGKVLAGSHIVEVKKESHRDIKRTITVEASKNETIKIGNPIPIYGSLNVTSEPLDATIFIDDKEVGKTPKILTQVLIGKHTVRIEKQGCSSSKREIVVAEGQMGNVNVELKVDGVATQQTTQKQETPQTPKSPQTLKKTTFITLNAAINTHSKLSYGLTFGQLKRFGWFASVMTNFDFKGFKADYECGSNFFVNGNYPFYTGKESYTTLSITGGFMMRVAKPVAIKIGAGYGMRVLSCETIDKQWVKNKAESIQGLDVVLGAHLNFGGFVVSLDCVTASFKEFEAKIGLGYGF